jgi:hypothetical protein
VNADPQGRADRFYVLFATLQGVPQLDIAEAARLTPLTSRGCACLETVTDEDLALASAALNVETELREAGWRAIERLGALVAGSTGSLSERIAALPDPEFVEAACCLLALGWVDDGTL